jgi:hypothetical protein
MATLGARALIDLAIPTGLDSGEILKFELQDGRTAQELIAEAAAMIGDVNEELTAEYGGLLTFTEEQYARYRQGEGSRSMTPRKVEFKRADGVRSDTIGHMLPLNDHEDAVEWTPLYLRRAFGTQINADLRLIRDRWRNRVDYDIIKRALTNTENAIGTSGYDVPWAIGTGTNVDFIPPQYRATEFDNTHSHFVVKDDDTKDYDDLLEDMMVDLRHHGISGMLTCLVAFDDVSSYTAFSTSGEFVELNPAGLTVIAGSSSAPVRVTRGEADGIPGELFGYWKSKSYGLCELRSHDRIPTDYAFMTKSYGVNNPENGLAVRLEPGVGFGLRVSPQATSDINPELDFIKFEATHGVGVNDRLNGVAGYIASGASSWSNPTIS